jgi:zinc resistance-associated protein
MLKPVIAATAILAIAGSSVVYAQQGFGDQHGFRHGHHRLSAADMAAFTDARIAALKAGLELTPDQQKNWPAFEQALRDLAQLRIQRIEARHQGDSGDQGQTATSPFDRLSKRADNMAKTSAALKKISDAGAPLYQSLNDAQKERFKMLARILRPHHRHMASNDRDGGWQGRGMGRGQGFGGEHHRGDGGDNDGGSGSQL